MVFAKTRRLNARGDISTNAVYYIVLLVIVLILVLYFTVPAFQEYVKQFFQEQGFAFTKTNIDKAKTMCGTTLSNCCGSTTCGFETALDLAENQKNQICLTSIADTCTLLRIVGCNITALKAGTYNISDNATNNFIEFCDQFYYDKIKCIYVNKTDTSCPAPKHIRVTYKCIDEDGIEHPKDSCIT